MPCYDGARYSLYSRYKTTEQEARRRYRGLVTLFPRGPRARAPYSPLFSRNAPLHLRWPAPLAKGNLMS